MEILQRECEIHKARIRNLFDRWERKSQERFLPPPENVGIFAELRKMNEKDQVTLRFLRDKQLKRWKTRSFEDVYTLTDRLSDMHFLQAVAERCYWQRMEGYEAAAVDAVRRGAFSEAGTIEQIFNGADFLCQAYWDRVFGENESDWHGMVNFGLFNEFRNLGPLIFAPDYVKLYNFKTWVYFAHETMHGALQALLQKGKLHDVFNDLVGIFSKVPHDLKSAEDEYLAMETICDIMSTLVAGEAYIHTLASLKFYPTMTACPSSGFSERGVQYPMIFRAVISGWAMRIAWGSTDSSLSKSLHIQELIDRVIAEDAAELKRIVAFLEADEEWLQKKLPEGKSLEEVCDQLENLWDYITCQYDVLPDVVRPILRARVIPRIKSVIKKDYYETGAGHFFYEFKDDNQWLPEHILYIDPVFCEQTSSASDVSLSIGRRVDDLTKTSMAMINGTLVTEADPSDIVSCLTYLETEYGASKPKELAESVAVMSIALQTRYSDRRFQVRKHFRGVNRQFKS
jgi:hypothetical protein